jgi:hypothetical protein
MAGFPLGEIQHDHQQHEEKKVLVNHDRLFSIYSGLFRCSAV